MSMNQITIDVDKARLLTALKENREKHGDAYRKAKAGYITVTIRQVEDYLRRLTDGELLGHAYLPSPPEDHTADYDNAIAMLEWSVGDTVELTQSQFAQYVQDDWGWRDSWITSNTAYLAAAQQ